MGAAAIPFLKLSKGSIVNISSQEKSEIVPLTTYNSGKALITTSFTEKWAAELTNSGVRVNEIKVCRYHHAEVIEHRFNKSEETFWMKIQRMVNFRPHITRPLDIARTVNFLLSGESQDFSGEILCQKGKYFKKLHPDDIIYT